MRAFPAIAAALASFSLAACGGSVVPTDMFLTLSVSTRDVAVETRINDALEEFVSGASGGLVSSAPINRRVREGENAVSFALSPVETPAGQTPDPALLATLEIVVRGETVDTAAPGARTIFSRELSQEEAARLIAGESIVLTETFTLERARLEAIKAAARG